MFHTTEPLPSHKFFHFLWPLTLYTWYLYGFGLFPTRNELVCWMNYLQVPKSSRISYDVCAFTFPTLLVFLSLLVCSGYSLLRDPHHNKGLAFTEKERDAHYLRGLLPPTVASQELQVIPNLIGPQIVSKSYFIFSFFIIST